MHAAWFIVAISCYFTTCANMTSTSVNKRNTSSNNLSLHYLVREPKVKTAKHKAIILLHGVGSNEQDLFSLADHLPDRYYVIAARGPFTLSAGRYAWYNVDFSTGKPVINAEQEVSSRAVIKQFVAQVKQKYTLDEIYLGGFSQGAIMSYSVGLSNPEEVNGIIALSGRVLEQTQQVVVRNEALSQLRIFIAHGTHDGTLPVHYARQAQAFLQTLHVPLTYHEYNMGHQVNGEVIQDLIHWLP